EQVKEAEQHMRRSMLDDECASALPTHHEPFGGQITDCLARRTLADAELGRNFELVGDELTWLPLAGANALDEPLAHPGIERAIGIFVGEAHRCHLAKARDGGAGHVLYKNARRRASQPRLAASRETRGKRVATPHFLVHSPKDNVGVVVVEGLRAGTEMMGVI